MFTFHSKGPGLASSYPSYPIAAVYPAWGAGFGCAEAEVTIRRTNSQFRTASQFVSLVETIIIFKIIGEESNINLENERGQKQAHYYQQ